MAYGPFDMHSFLQTSDLVEVTKVFLDKFFKICKYIKIKIWKNTMVDVIVNCSNFPLLCHELATKGVQHKGNDQGHSGHVSRHQPRVSCR